MRNGLTGNGKNLRKGYTTGSCAAAASKAAVIALCTGVAPEKVEIDTPAGVKLSLPVCDYEFGGGTVKCAVVKDGGDDPDVTTGLKIFSQARFKNESGIEVLAGPGIGTATLPGLKVEPGRPAINPVPMRMIVQEASRANTCGRGLEITLSVPGGEEVASRTYNPRLGIKNGISILGTTGIVEPVSDDAWKESLEAELGVMAANGRKAAAFVFGRTGEECLARELRIAEGHIVRIGNFVGFTLRKALGCGFEKVLIAGHAGKLVKVSAGVFNTHSGVADARMETLTAFAALEGADRGTLEELYACRNTDSAFAVINENSLEGVYRRIVAESSRKCGEYAFGKLKVGSVLLDSRKGVLAADDNALELIEELRGKKV